MDIVAVGNNSCNLMCRLCLSTDDYLLSVFDECHTFLPQRIAACVNVEVHKSDKMPTTICKSCFTKVDEWFNFKKSCDDSQSKLRQWASINSIICNKTMNMTIQVKEDVQPDSEDIQIIENEISVFKEEPIEEIYLQSDTEEVDIETDPFALQPCDPQNSAAYESGDSLLVPTYECPATVHGMNAPPINTEGSPLKISSLTRKCGVCSKKFSSAHNRIRHERTVHNIDSLYSYVETSADLGSEITNINSVNSEDSNSNNNVGEASGVTLEQFAASLQLVQSTSNVPNRPISERHFIEYNKMLSQMVTNLCCYFCGLRYNTNKSLLAHLSKVLKIEKFTCFFCCIAFPNRSQFMKHVSKKFCKQRSRFIRDINCPFKAYQHYKCTICDELYVHKMLIVSHLLSCHLESEHPPSCNRCDQPFQEYNEYKEHLQSSCYYKIYCSICKISYSPEEFNEHCKIHEENNLEFNFDDYINKKYDCRTKTANAKPFIENTNVNKYSCSRCGEQFPTLDMWCEHQQVHSDNDIHRCTECNRVFVTELELEQHKNTHANNNIKLKLYRCSDTNSYKAVSDFSSSNSLELEQNVNRTYEPQQQQNNAEKIEEKKNFRCSVCKKYYPTQLRLRAHKRQHSNVDYKLYTKRRRSCPKCNRSFGNAGNFAAHKKECLINKEKSTTVVNIKKEYSELNGANAPICQVCNKSFPTEKGLLLHSKLHTSRENDSEKMQCQVCNQEFLNIETLLDHLKSHSTKSLNTILQTEKPAIECKICNKMCANNSGLTKHMKIHYLNPTSPQVRIKTEPESKSFKCNFCSMEFDNRTALNSHIKIHLNGANIAYNCTFCPKVCSNGYQLSSHVKFKHANEPSNVKIKQEFPNHRCHVCKKNFLTDALLQTHFKSHTKKVKVNKKFKCESCSKIMASASALNRHIKGNCLFCAKCNKNFTTVQALSSHKGWHMRRHSTSTSLFNCNYCNAEFHFQKDYVKHLKSHKKTYKCKFCQKAFHYMKSLLTHSNFVHGTDGLKTKTAVKNPVNFKVKREMKNEVKQERPSMYRCTECNTTFVNSKQLRLHVLATHMSGDM